MTGDVMMIQMGARRNYIYARQLAEAGLLHSLVCDAAWPAVRRPWPARALGRLSPRLRGAIDRRSVADIPPDRLFATPVANIVSTLASRWYPPERVHAVCDDVLARSARRAANPPPRVVVNYAGNGGGYLSEARAHGAVIVTDFIITPYHLRIEREEQTRWPGWASARIEAATVAFYEARIARLLEASDLYLCPSPAVAEDLGRFPAFVADRVRHCPYGMSGTAVLAPRTVPGRVLFAGEAGLRKGLPYLAAAADRLKTDAPLIEIRVAGAVADAVRCHPATANLTFLGKLDAATMAREFAEADLFCLPSLAEGSATVIFEAMANHLPVVTTAASGSVVADGEQGLVVASRDGAALAQAILAIVGDRAMRTRMSRCAAATIANFSDERCGARFLAIVDEARRMSREGVTR